MVDRMVYHEAVTHCLSRGGRPQQQLLAWPAESCGQPAGHSRSESAWLSCADDAGHSQVERPVLILALYRPAVGGDSSRSAQSTVETRLWSPLPSWIDLMRRQAAVVRRPAFSGANPCPLSRSGAASAAASAPSRPIASALRAAARLLVAVSHMLDQGWRGRGVARSRRSVTEV